VDANQCAIKWLLNGLRWVVVGLCSVGVFGLFIGPAIVLSRVSLCMVKTLFVLLAAMTKMSVKANTGKPYFKR
jgi:hypothetical protein